MITNYYFLKSQRFLVSLCPLFQYKTEVFCPFFQGICIYFCPFFQDLTIQSLYLYAKKKTTNTTKTTSDSRLMPYRKEDNFFKKH